MTRRKFLALMGGLAAFVADVAYAVPARRYRDGQYGEGSYADWIVSGFLSYANGSFGTGTYGGT